MHIYQPIYFNSPLQNTSNHSRPLQKHPKPLQKLLKTPKILQKLQFLGPNFLAFFAVLRPFMTHTGSPMFSKPPLTSLNLHYYL